MYVSTCFPVVFNKEWIFLRPFCEIVCLSPLGATILNDTVIIGGSICFYFSFWWLK